MADFGNVLYSPPQQQPGLLTGSPMQAIGAARQLQEMSLFPLRAYQLQLQNQTQQFGLQAAQNSNIYGVLSGLANKPNVSADDVNAALAMIGRTTNIPSSTLATVGNYLTQDPSKIHDQVVNIRNMAAGAGATMQRTPMTDPLTGQSYSGPIGGMDYSGTGGMIPTNTPPGFAERQKGAAAIDVGLSKNLADAAESSPARLGMLGNLENDLRKFTAGPSADWTRVGKAWINRNIPLPDGWQFDPQSIASQENFNKQAMQLAQAQFQSIGGTGTDEKFSSAFHTSPNEALSQLGNQGIIRLLKGNEDALQAKNKAWLAASAQAPNLSYRQFSQAFNNHFDPRVFQFAYMNQKERQEYVDHMQPQDQRKLMGNIGFARQHGWVNY